MIWQTKGNLGLDPKTGELVSGGIAAEARQALTNIGFILEEAGLTYNHVVKTTVLLADINDFSTLNGIYAEFFTSKHPARSTYQVAALPKGSRVFLNTRIILFLVFFNFLSNRSRLSVLQ